jgi:hypothetical protein
MPEPRWLWIHLSGKGVGEGSVKASLISRYLENLSKLVRDVALFRGYVDKNCPIDSFQLFFYGGKKGSFKGLLALPPLPTLCNPMLPGNAQDRALDDFESALKQSSLPQGEKYFTDTYSNPVHAVTVMQDLQKLCPPQELHVRFTETPILDPEKQVKYDFAFTGGERENLTTWIESMETPESSIFTGFFAGFRAMRNVFWVLDDAENEYRCNYDDNRLKEVIQAARSLDKLEIKGKIMKSARGLAYIDNITSLRNIDKEEELQEMKGETEEEMDPVFRDRLAKSIKSGKTITRDEMLKRLASSKTD